MATHTVDDGDGVCGDCLFCEENMGGDCRVPEHERCNWCGHCLGNHDDLLEDDARREAVW